MGIPREITVSGLQGCYARDERGRPGSAIIHAEFSDAGGLKAAEGRHARVTITRGELAELVGSIPILEVPDGLTGSYMRVIRWLKGIELPAESVTDVPTAAERGVEPGDRRFRCHGCGATISAEEDVTAHKRLHGLVTQIEAGGTT